MNDITKSKPETQGLCPLDLLDAELKGRTIMGDAERTAVALWIGHTYVFHHFKHTPRLFLTSHGPGCGKSELGRLIAHFSRGGKKYEAGATYASIRDYRRNPEDCGNRVTCVIDQLDGMGKTSSDDWKLMNLFCSSTETKALTTIKEKRIRKDKETFENVEIPIGYPVALGKIGDIPNDALMSRCIPIRMQKETRDERKAQMEARMKEPPHLYDAFNGWFDGSWKVQYIEAPKGTDSRVEDMWQPLLNVARHAGPAWEKRARDALVELHDEDGPEMTQELRLIKLIYERTRNWKRKDITNAELTVLLGSDSEYQPRRRGRILSSFGIKPKKRDDERFIWLADVDTAARRLGFYGTSRDITGRSPEKGRVNQTRDDTTKNT